MRGVPDKFLTIGSVGVSFFFSAKGRVNMPLKESTMW
jgi:hypothetical protein